MGALARAVTLRGIQSRRRLTKGESGQSFLKPLFAHQLRFVESRERQKVLLAPRRAGKTELNKAYLYKAVLEPGSVAHAWVPGRDPPIARYWAPTKDRAREMMYRPLVRFAEQWNIPIRTSDSTLTIFTAGGGEIRCVGADKDKEAQKKRGDKTVLEVIDESSVYGPYLESLVTDVVGPSLLDLLGICCLMGTPGVIWKGFWFDVSGPKGSRRRAWEQHWFDVYDNAALPHMRREIEKERIANGWNLDSPTYLRERRGKWVKDTGAMFYAWQEGPNTYRKLPTLPRGAEWDYSLGWDLGNPENMALTLWAFSSKSPNLYEVYSRQGFENTEAIAAQCTALEGTHGGISYRVADCGGLGGRIVEEFGKRFGIHFQAAKKTEKYAHVVLFNEDLRAGRVKTRAGSALSNELATIPKSIEDPTEPDDRFPDHCSDAGLYAWRRAWHWDGKTPEKEPAHGSKEEIEREEEREHQRAVEELEESNSWRDG